MKENIIFLTSPKEHCVPRLRPKYTGETGHTLAGDDRTVLLPD